MTDPTDSKTKWTRCFSKEANMIRIDSNLVGIAYIPLQIDLSKSDAVANLVIAVPALYEASAFALKWMREHFDNIDAEAEEGSPYQTLAAALAAARGES